MAISAGLVIGGKYRLDRPLAKGGMGTVWVARHLQLGAEVAVKLMEPAAAASPESRHRFEREAKASMLIKSPHVVQVMDYGVEDGMPYLVLELLEGEDLAARLRREGRLSLPAAHKIVEPICKALRRAHDAGLVHRDLKPANIFLARHDDEDLVKILDFGIVKAPVLTGAADRTRTGAVLGSPLYMSPEQIRQFSSVDRRSDLWSLGVTLYQALTGHLPFPSSEIGALLVSICTDPVRPPSLVVPGLGPEVDGFFTRALARDPAARFQTAPEFAEAFAAVASGRSAGPAAGVPAFTPAVTPAPIFGPPPAPRAVEPARVPLASAGTLAPADKTYLSSTGISPARRTLGSVAGVLALSTISAVIAVRVANAPADPAPAALPRATAPEPSAAVPPLPPATAAAPAVTSAQVAVAAPPASPAAPSIKPLSPSDKPRTDGSKRVHQVIGL